MRDHKKSARGSAVTEFIICMFPYMLILLGAIFFWHLAVGKQKLFDYSQSAATLGQGKDSFGNFDGKKTLRSPVRYDSGSELAYNAKVGVRTEIDEPVLPYSEDGEDFKACVSRGVYNVHANADGSINVHMSSQGRRYKEKGLITDTVTGDNLSADTNISFEVNPEIARAVSQALSRWITYTGVDGGRYRYTLQFGAGETLGLETGVVTDNWRSRNGVTVGGNRVFGAYSARIEDSGLRGSYTDVRLSDLDAVAGTQVTSLDKGAELDGLNYNKYFLDNGQ